MIVDYCVNFLKEEAHKEEDNTRRNRLIQAARCLQELERKEGLAQESLNTIYAVATGEMQVADDDTEGLKWIANYIVGAT